jgi:hypothetical protein
MVKLQIVEENKFDIVTLLKQRRVWAAVLSAIAVFSVALGYPLVAQLCGVLAGSLGLASYISPKK